MVRVKESDAILLAYRNPVISFFVRNYYHRFVIIYALVSGIRTRNVLPLFSPALSTHIFPR